MTEIIVIANNIRSTHNVGSLLRTAEGLGIKKVYLTGYTPYPMSRNESRLPHIAKKLDDQISKTALDAEKSIDWAYVENIKTVISVLKSEGYLIAALEQTASSVSLKHYKVPDKIALILGREVEGLEIEVIKQCDITLEIPMYGKKESFNVVQAAAMAMYHLRFS